MIGLTRFWLSCSQVSWRSSERAPSEEDVTAELSRFGRVERVGLRNKSALVLLDRCVGWCRGLPRWWDGFDLCGAIVCCGGVPP
jgi:hypothetical protein